MKHDPSIVPRLRTLLDDITGKGFRLSLPRLVLDELETQHLPDFIAYYNEEFDAALSLEDITDDTTFRDLVEQLQDQ